MDNVTASINSGTWRLDPAHSTVEFHVRHFWGLITVKGKFDRYTGTLDLAKQPAISLKIEADSLDTNQKKRDEHLRSADFFDIDNHPEVTFESESATLVANTLQVTGTLEAAGKKQPIRLDARITQDDGHPHIEATTSTDHRQLDMTWSPLGMLRAPSRLVVKGRLIPA